MVDTPYVRLVGSIDPVGGMEGAGSRSEYRVPQRQWRRTREEVTHLTIALTREDVGLTTPAAPVAPQGIADAETLAKLVFASLDDSKAEDIVSIDIRAKSSLADTMIVASGRSHRHVGAIADRLIEDLKARGVDDIRVEGLAHCDWVLVDLGDVLVHVFRPEVRGFYNLEKMWAAEPMAPRSPRPSEA